VAVRPGGPYLADMLAAGVAVAVLCRGCQRTSVLAPAMAPAESFENRRLANFAWTCPVCGSRAGDATIVGRGWRVGPLPIGLSGNG